MFRILFTDNQLKTVIHWLACAALAVPLVFSVYLYPSHIAPQTFLFRLLVEMMAVVYAALVLKDSAYAPKRSAVTWAFGAYVAALVVSAVLGEGTYRSFFSDFDRHWGIVTIAHVFAFFLILSSVFRDAASWRRLFSVSAGASALVALYGLYQLLFMDVGRVYSTVGNPGFLATYLLLNAIFALWLAAERSFAFWGSVAVLNVLVMFFTATRGAVIALVAGALAYYIGYLFFFKKNGNGARARTWMLAAFALLVLCAGAGYAARDTAFFRSAGLSALYDFSPSQITAKTRLFAWEAGWKAFRERPFSGTGPEHFNVAFNKYFDTDYYTWEIAETEFDRAHNIFVETAVTGGLIALLPYLLLFASMFALAARLPALSGHARIAVWAFVAAYAGQGLLGMDTLTSFMPLALLAAFVVSSSSREEARDAKEYSFSFTDAATVALVFAVAVYLAYTVNGKPFLADRAFSDADALHQELSALAQKDFTSSGAALYEKALSYGTYGRDTIRASLARFALDVQGTLGRNTEGFPDRLLPLAFAEAQKNANEHPYNYFYQYYLARLYNLQYLSTKTEDAALEERFAAAEALGPGRLELPLASAQRSFAKGDYRAAIEKAEIGIAKHPKFRDFYRVAFVAYSIEGDAENAFRMLDAGVSHGLVLMSENEIGWLAAQYEVRGMPEKAAELLKRYE